MGDGWLRYFPVGSFRPIRDIAGWAGQALDRLGESPLQPVGPHKPLVVRLLCLPTWSPSCSVRIERSGLSWLLAARELDGEAGGDDLLRARAVAPDRPRAVRAHPVDVP